MQVSTHNNIDYYVILDVDERRLVKERAEKEQTELIDVMQSVVNTGFVGVFSDYKET